MKSMKTQTKLNKIVKTIQDIKIEFNNKIKQLKTIQFGMKNLVL